MFGKNMTLGSKVLWSMGLVTLSLVAVGGYGLYTISSLRGSLDQVVNREVRKLVLTAGIESGVSNMVAAQRAVMLKALTGDSEGAARMSADLSSMQQELDRKMSQLGPLVTAERGKAVFDRMREQAEAWARVTPVWSRAILGQRFDEATQLQNLQFRPIQDRFASEARAMVELQQAQLSETVAKSDGAAAAARLISLLLVVCGAALAGLGLYAVMKANAGLRRIAGEIAEGARQVASAAQQVSSASQSLAQGSSEQAATLEETSASTEEINSMTQKNAENARNASGMVTESTGRFSQATLSLDRMVKSMAEINESSQKISKIIRVIDEIAFQTNILALNAAVEAARAGEAGMGFAVVADEVRNLAQRCAQAAKDTAALIEESITKSGEGRARVGEVAGAIQEVATESVRVKTLVEEVSLGSQEQARGIEQIARAVQQMQQVTQATAAGAEESASAGEEMSAQAESLNESVRRLHELVGTEHGPAKAFSAPARVERFLPSSGSRRSASYPRAKAAGFPLDEDFRDF